MAALLATPVLSIAQESQPSLPYREVSAQAEDSHKVVVFFSFACPVCASYDQTFSRWAKTLPPGWSAEFLPVAVPDKGNYIAARAFFAVQDADPSRLAAFMSAAYTLIQQNGMTMEDPGTWSRAVAMADVQGFNEAWHNVTQQRLERAFAKLLTYGVDATPSMVISGKYVITPDDVSGDSALYMNLANGMISKVMQER
ncbi:thiol:disulfide interchange protein DsbA/DsbL [Pseudomonas alloputida]|uniref:Thiol:disulfide interchange protein n=5 Tax=Pseudomonas TaxID=286 RepID=A0A3G1DH26_PSEAI|nr:MULTISPECIES: thiol:disulfide interchange protein DsbA/DsbL [Pseudomonas]MCO6692587.1 thiol:disulfide interchange protein DsbA/DsbL [Pseudomonas shirazica]TRZ57782.1 thiol:disulfide interchange protein DsbA/DsbL [Pseudomonas alloputida]HEE9761704.1 thiol:disulfide interchange protein DsbA/DsbL [Pseudomonas putida]AMP35996.1 Thiol:disulfide interchange protein [Pseudomonas aeruginosa]ESW38313.1 thiol:disulfide interchange protein [Pseudomonas taiwanensis SJ9]